MFWKRRHSSFLFINASDAFEVIPISCFCFLFVCDMNLSLIHQLNTRPKRVYLGHAGRWVYVFVTLYMWPIFRVRFISVIRVAVVVLGRC